MFVALSKVNLTKIPSLTIADIDFEEIGAFNFDFEESPQIKCYTRYDKNNVTWPFLVYLASYVRTRMY